ncbi:MAG TPA: Uma2 family endonuclease [Acetobacteraceae bacterium]|nr:Uma2 family endonuclease [Acetobacteraceae bacterium]
MGKTALTREPETRMSRQEYRAWLDQQPDGRFERIQGVVVAMAPERAEHALCKARIWQALDRAVREAGLPCEVYPDGMTVEVGDSDYEPDAVLRCGAALGGKAIAVPDPLIIVEVLSPTTSGIDRAWKLREYFRLPSLRHYLIVRPDMPHMVRHTMLPTGEVETRVFTTGEIALAPPGIGITVEEVYTR